VSFPEEIESSMTENMLTGSRRWIEQHGDYLYRFALARVRNPHSAEDLVQETFLAALQGTCRENGPTAERRWMIGIIKHKIVDHLRRSIREPVLNHDQSDRRTAEEDFLPDGRWKPEMAAVHQWPEKPDGLLDRKQFRDALAACLDRLPPRAAQVFTLREMDEVEMDEIGRLLCLTPTNLGVILHRARKQLRNCLSRRYFGLSRDHEAP
jgi:RNA polymerase sigma-70 factor (ECF subfamily)